MKTWYVYSTKKNKFIKIAKSDLVSGDIVCCKNDNGFLHIDDSTVFVVIHPESENGEFRVRSLVVVVGAIVHARKEYGIYFLPQELDLYIQGDRLNDDLVDENWGVLQFRKDASEWLEHTNSRLKQILSKECSE